MVMEKGVQIGQALFTHADFASRHSVKAFLRGAQPSCQGYVPMNSKLTNLFNAKGVKVCLSPQICTDPHRLICVDECRFVVSR